MLKKDRGEPGWGAIWLSLSPAGSVRYVKNRTVFHEHILEFAVFQDHHDSLFI
jgi:hypothetical protein